MEDKIYLYDGSGFPDNMSEAQYLIEFEKLTVAKARQEEQDSKLRFPNNIYADQITQKFYASAFEFLKEKYEEDKINPVKNEPHDTSLLDEMIKRRELNGEVDDDPGF